MPLLITRGLGEDTPVIIQQRIVTKLQAVITSVKTKPTRAAVKKTLTARPRKKTNGTATIKTPKKTNGRAKKKDTLIGIKKNN